MCNWAGKFKLIFYFLLLICTLSPASAQESNFNYAKWEDFSKQVEQQKKLDKQNGISYIISGSLALAGGIWAASLSEDIAERGIYTVFQTIGIASIGYGAYVWDIGGEERSIYTTLSNSQLSKEQKSQFLNAYNLEKKEREKRDRRIRAVTHGLIAGLNFYNSSQQKSQSLKNTLNFIGGVNLLAAISFTVEF